MNMLITITEVGENSALKPSFIAVNNAVNDVKLELFLEKKKKLILSQVV